ncbi:hematopoietic death receptor [Pungitius pungitius]|uniref:hematopoietic death receptor n=1 Tax=Pungitius pungitius TaxID=134920 RepID=UPI002E12598B
MSSALPDCLRELTRPNQSMDKLLGFYILILFLKPSEASPLSNCRDGLEYTNGVCCSKCPAGKRQASPCTRPGEAGTCEECDDGTFTEHANVLNQCLKCTRCRADQEVVRPCTHTQDGECQCKAGRFCAPDQACEVCKKCSRCKEDEELVRNCTSTSNTECKKRQLQPTSASGNAWVFVLPILALGLLAGIFIVWKCLRGRGSPMNPHGWKAGNPDSDDCADEDVNDRSNGGTQRLGCLNVTMPWHLVRAAEGERKTLRHSPGSSTSSSERSLTGFPASPAYPAPPPRAAPTAPVQPDRREEEEEEEVFPKLVAVNGEESLRKCFEYFEDVDVHLHKKFFRHLNVSDNVIKSKDHLPYDDRIHDLLTIWVEKEGRGATLNDLLTALLNLHQRRTAEIIKEKAMRHGHYNVEA